MDLKNFILSNPKKIKVPLHLYNRAFGFNSFRMKKGNKLSVKAVLCKKTKFIINGIGNIINIDDFSRLNNCIIFINGNNNTINISSRVYLNEAELCIEDDNNEISIGQHTSIHGKTHLAAIESTKISIGQDCMFSGDIQFRTGDSHSITNLEDERINYSEDICLGDHVWIGTKVICLKGVIILDNCIVGANSLLNKKYDEKNCIIAGNPAKVVKHNINWLRERIKSI